MMATGKVNVTNKENVSRLHPTDVMKTMININRHPELIKQGSDEWKTLCHAANITGSTAYNALGCRGGNSMRAHYDEFIYKKGPPTFDLETQRKLDHGRQHEVNYYY